MIPQPPQPSAGSPLPSDSRNSITSEERTPDEVAQPVDAMYEDTFRLVDVYRKYGVHWRAATLSVRWNEAIEKWDARIRFEYAPGVLAEAGIDPGVATHDCLGPFPGPGAGHKRG